MILLKECLFCQSRCFPSRSATTPWRRHHASCWYISNHSFIQHPVSITLCQLTHNTCLSQLTCQVPQWSSSVYGSSSESVLNEDFSEDDIDKCSLILPPEWLSDELNCNACRLYCKWWVSRSLK
jgi:hypothetical protein